MADETLHPNVAFAKRYGDTTGNFLNAYVALVRIDSLVDDAVELKATLQREASSKERWAPWFGAEVVSYYAVGYVTCFEWHARSRIADLFSYKPSCLKPDDLRGQISEKVMVQMLAEGASVARLLAASVSIGSFRRYMQVMTRVFAEAGVPYDPYACLKEADPGGGWSSLEAEEFEQLDYLFSFRNELVHEIGIQIVGHPNIRDNWDPDVALRTGRLAHAVMRRLEAALRRFAPADFPNLLDEGGYPASAFERLSGEIAGLEEAVDRAISEDASIGPATKVSWTRARNAARLGDAEQLDFISHADFLSARYIDLRERVRLEVVEARVRYLRLLLSDLTGESGLITPTPSADSEEDA